MPRPTTHRTTTTISLDLVVEVSADLYPAEPDVGISEPYYQDLTIERIGTEFNEPGSKVDWAPFDYDIPTERMPEWLTGCIIEQCGDQLEEKLSDAT